MAKWSTGPSALTLDWAGVCRGLTSQQAVRCLHRFTSGLAALLSAGERISNDSCQNFLEKRVAYDLLGGRRLENTHNLTLTRSLDALHRKIMELNSGGALNPKDVSLSLNSYAKFYQNLASTARAGQLHTPIPTEQLKKYLSELLEVANKNIGAMNEQDLSLVLNCISKVRVRGDEFLHSADNLLHNAVREFHSLEGGPESGNLVKTMTPQGVALALNCFAKSEVDLNKNVVAFFVDEYLPKMGRRFQINQLVVALNALLKFGITHERVAGTLRLADAMLKRSTAEYNMKLLSTALYTFARYSYHPAASIDGIMSHLEGANVAKASELELSNVYYALGKLNLRNLGLLEKMNAAAAEKLGTFTPPGVVGIYHALSKLDYKEFLAPGGADGGLERAFVTRFAAFFDRGPAGATDTNFPVIPLHAINFAFSCAINYCTDPSLYNSVLRKLSLMIGNDPTSELRSNILENYRQELSADRDQFKFFSKYVGIQGIYQLYCVFQHVAKYVRRGLWALDHAVLSSANALFDQFRLATGEGKRRGFGEEPIVGTNEGDVVTSKTHEAVYAVLENVVKGNGAEASGPWKNAILYKEHEALPYTIDIVLFKF